MPTDPRDSKEFYRKAYAGAPMTKVVSVRMSQPMFAALQSRAMAEGVDISALCRRYLTIAALEEELNLQIFGG